MMKLIELNLKNAWDVKKFIKFPFNLYRDNKYWVPPLISDMKFALNNQTHPFYKHSQAIFFMVEENGKVIGRIAALKNQRYIEHTNERTAFFCFFESINDFEVSRLLFNASSEWARKNGLEKIIGPKGLAQGDGLGLLVKGFDFLPAIGIPYNLPYYIDLIKDFGFQKRDDYYSGYMTTDYQLPEKLRKLVDKIKKRYGFWIKEFQNKDEMRDWITRIQDVYNKAFSEVPNFVPISEEEVKLIAERILSVADPKLIKLIFKDEELIGFLFSYHNISEGLQKANGKLFPFGWYYIMRAFKQTTWVDINGIGLLPRYQGLGATAVLYAELEKSIKSYPFKKADIVQIAETNMKSFTEAEHLGVQWHKIHRIFEKSL